MALANQPAKAPAADLAEGLSGPAASPTASIMAGDGPIAIPQASLLFDAEFVRSGDDLTLVSHDGQELLIADYFGAGAPDLIAPNHAMLDGQTVTLLAGPQFPGQYAQAGGATQAAEPIGSVETLQGTVTAQRADGTTHELKVGDPVFESDVIATGPGSNIGMKLADGTLVTLQESGKLAINEFVYQADGADNSALLNVIQGTFSLFAGQVAPTGDMQIKTPIATMGIRGTSILGVNVDAILGRLSLTQDPDGHVGFIEIFNNQNGNLFTVLRTVFEKITISESGLLSLTPKTPEELGIDQTLTELLHNFYNQVPQQGPDTSPQPQTGSPFFQTPNIQEIIFDPAGPQDGTELLLPQELLEQFLESLLEIQEIRDEIILALSENPTAGQVILDDQLEADAEAGEGGDPVETTLPFDFGSSGPGSVGFAALDGQPVVDANGQPVTNDDDPLVYVWDPATNTLTAVVQGEEGELGETVFTIEVNPTTGEVTVTINGSLDHFAPNGEFLPIDIPFTVQAANGATATGTLTVVVGDDVPAFSNPDRDAPGVSNAIVDEDDIDGVQGIQPPGTDGSDNPTASGNLKVDFGADGFGETAFTGAFQVPNGGSGVLQQSGPGVDSGLTSDGQTVLFRLLDGGQVIEGYIEGVQGQQDQIILRATLNENDAGYEVELLGNIDHQPPNDTNNRDEAQSINFTVAASDGDGDPIEATLSVRIKDDAPVAAGDVAEVCAPEQQVPTSNVIILLDRSNSMNVSGNDEDSRFDLAKNAAYNLLMAAGIGGVLVVDFANNVHASGWISASDAKDHIDRLDAVGGQTDLDDALLRAGLHFPGAPDADNTFIYVLSDGGAKNGDTVKGLFFWEEAAWKVALHEFDVDGVFGYTVGGNGDEQLTPVTWNPETWSIWNPLADGSDVADLTNPNQLLDHYYDLIGYEPPVATAQGNVLDNDNPGADGVETIASIVIDGDTYTYDADGGSIITLPDGFGSGDGPFEQVLFDGQLQQPQPDSAITIDTDQGGRFTFHFADDPQGGHEAGDWKYEAPLGETTFPYEHVRYTVTDGDGDQSTSDLIIEIKPDEIQNVEIRGEGDDTLTSVAGDTEVLVGGLGADKFVLNSFEVSDFIADYNQGEGDVIDLSALLDGYNQVNQTSLTGDQFLSDHVSYNSNNGDLSVDSTVVATLGNTPANVTIVVDDSPAPNPDANV